MSHRLFECNSCSYKIFVPQDAGEPMWCPYCRGAMYDVEEAEPGPGTEYVCDECGYAFRIAEGTSPAYKCARCNYTFPSTPGRKRDHKL